MVDAVDNDTRTRRPTIRVVIADDHPIFRDGLRRLLESEPGFQVVGEAQDGAEAVKVARELRPDILLLDVAMPRVTGLLALQEMANAGDKIPTLVLTAAIEEDDVVTALQLGARGVVLKDTATQILFKAIRCVIDGQFWVGRESVSNLVNTLRKMVAASSEQASKKTFGLTKREFEIIGAIVSGYSNKDIAQEFKISEDTVKHHLTNVFDKVGVSSRLELALFAVNHKLVEET